MQLLFSDLNIHNEIDQRKRSVNEAIQAIDRDDLLHKDPQLIADDLLARHWIQVPRLRDDAIKRGPVPITEAELDVFIPFEGDESLFKYSPEMHHHSYDRTLGEIINRELHITVPLSDYEPDHVKHAITQRVGAIRETLEKIRRNVSAQEQSIRADVLRSIQNRKDLLIKAIRLETELPYPLRQEPSAEGADAK